MGDKAVFFAAAEGDVGGERRGRLCHPSKTDMAIASALPGAAAVLFGGGALWEEGPIRAAICGRADVVCV